MRTTLPGEPPIELQVRHAPRARRISLRVSGRDGRVTLSVPPGTSVAEAIGFARSREAWLRRVLAEVPPLERPAPGGRLWIEGRALPIVAAPVRRVALAGGQLRVPAGVAVGPALAGFLRVLTRSRGEAAVRRYAPQLASYRRAIARQFRLDAERVVARLLFVQVGQIRCVAVS